MSKATDEQIDKIRLWVSLISMICLVLGAGLLWGPGGAILAIGIDFGLALIVDDFTRKWRKRS